MAFAEKKQRLIASAHERKAHKKRLTCSESRIIKTISKGVVIIISPFLRSYIAGVATCFIIRTSTADLYLLNYSLDWLEVTQTAVVCLNW